MTTGTSSSAPTSNRPDEQGTLLPAAGTIPGGAEALTDSAGTTGEHRFADPLLLLAWVGAFGFLFLTWLTWSRALGYDSHAYWSVWRHHLVYGRAPNHKDAFLYSPLFAQLIWPLTLLPWPVFLAGWTAAGFAIYAWLLWPLDWRWRLPLLCMCVPQAVIGNVWPLFALALVFGFRRPSLWAVPLLVKVTSAMGLVWFAARGEWRAAARALLLASALVAVSAAADPGLWSAWVHLLLHGGSASGSPSSSSASIPLWPRLPVALTLAVYGARKSRVGFLCAAVAIGSPVFALSLFMSSLFMFTALPRLALRSELAGGRAAAEPDRHGGAAAGRVVEGAVLTAARSS